MVGQNGACVRTVNPRDSNMCFDICCVACLSLSFSTDIFASVPWGDFVTTCEDAVVNDFTVVSRKVILPKGCPPHPSRQWPSEFQQGELLEISLA
jgi:hypothetical protein